MSTCISKVFPWFPALYDSWALWPAARHSDPSQYREGIGKLRSYLKHVALSSATLTEFFWTRGHRVTKMPRYHSLNIPLCRQSNCIIATEGVTWGRVTPRLPKNLNGTSKLLILNSQATHAKTTERKTRMCSIGLGEAPTVLGRHGNNPISWDYFFKVTLRVRAPCRATKDPKRFGAWAFEFQPSTYVAEKLQSCCLDKEGCGRIASLWRK